MSIVQNKLINPVTLNDLKVIGIVELFHNITDHVNRKNLFFEPNGIHGVLHADRVLILVLILSKLNMLTAADQKLLIEAALYHDIGRKNNYLCYQHGKDSIAKMKQLQLFSQDLSQEDQNILIYIIENHCISDKDALAQIQEYHINDPNRAMRLFAIFKDSDALDRCRIHDLNVSYLRNPYSYQLTELAEALLKQGDQLLK